MWIVWWLLFFMISKIEGLLEIQKSSRHSVTRRTVKTLLESCYKNDNSSNPIVIFGEYNDIIDKSVIIRINSSFETVRSSKNRQLFNPKVSKAVLIEDTSEQLQSDLKLLKTTKWWNHMAQFFIIMRNDEECKNFKDILIIMWKMNIINSILICSSRNTSALYTLNPFANYAPYPWVKIEDLDNLNVFRQVFHANVSCNHLNYDKTRNLHGYKVMVIGRSFVCKCGNDCFNSTEGQLSLPLRYLHVIIETLNASYRLERESNINRMLENLENNEHDLSLWRFALHVYPEKLMLNPYPPDTILALVQLNPEVPTLYKIIHMWSPPVLVGASIVLATFSTILAIIYCNFPLAILDLTRLLTYVSMKLNNRSHSFRIYFTTILIFMVISNGVLQGKIAAYLTKPERFPTIGTVDQLIESGYKFYTHNYWSDKAMGTLCLKCNMTFVPVDDCRKFLSNTTLNVCIIDESYYYHANWSDFDVEPIKNPFDRVYRKHLCRDDWPLYNRVNDILSVIMESGLSKLWVKRIMHLKSKKRQARDEESNLAHYRTVRLVKLDFAFKFLAVGLSLSVCCFFIEVLLVKYRHTQ